MMKSAILLLAYLTAVHAFSCPDDSHTFYHADVSTGCQVYHRCENSQLQTLTCPSGQAFNHETSKCEDSSAVNCIETIASHAHHHHKRAIEELSQDLSLAMMDDSPRRSKREAVPDFIYDMVRPFINDMIQFAANGLVGNVDSFTSKVLLPTFYDMLGDEESKYDLLGVTLSAKAIYAPVAWEMMKKETFDTPEGTIITIPRKLVEDANRRFQTETKPFLYKLAGRHLQRLFARMSENVPALLDGFRQLEDAKYKHVGVLKDAVFHFMAKHGTVLQSSTSSHITTYTLTEILEDLQPIKMTLLQIFIEFFKNNQESLYYLLFGENSFVKKQVIPPPVYAEQKPKVSKWEKPKSTADDEYEYIGF